MSGKMLIINPSKRRGGKKRRASSGGKKRASRRRVTSIKALRRRRSRNPIGSLRSVVPMLTNAATGAAGAIAVDYGWGAIKRMLPAAVAAPLAQPAVGAAAKVAVTVVAGRMLSRVTRGLSEKAAQGAVTVQLDHLFRAFLPASVQQSLAFANPSPIIQGTYWTGPNAARRGAPLRGLTSPGAPTPLLSGLVRPGAPTPLLSGGMSGVAIATRRAGIPMR